MKKLLSFIVLIAVCLCITFVGCFESIDENEPEFKTVSYVNLVSGGIRVSATSMACLIGGSNESMLSTESEYEQAEYPYRLFGPNGYFNGISLGASKIIYSYYGLTVDDIDCYVFWGSGVYNPWTDKYLEYRKHKFKGWRYQYAHVKVVNDKKLVVYVDGNFEVNSESVSHATTYEVTSYQIGIVYD